MNNKYYLLLAYSLILNICNAQKWDVNMGSAGLIPLGYLVNYIKPVDDSLVWVLLSEQSAAKPAKLMRTRNGGGTWQVTDVPNTTEQDAYKIVAFDSLTLFLHTYSLYDTTSIYKTTDGGKTWAKKLKIPSIGSLGFFDERNGIVVGAEKNLVALTTDGGETWRVDSTTAKPFAKESTSLNLDLPINGDTIRFVTCSYASGKKLLNRFFRSTDRGKTWSAFNIPLTATEFDASLVFRDGKNGLLTTFNNSQTTGAALVNILTTKNGGETWDNLPNLPSFFRTLQIPVATYVPKTENSYVLLGVINGINSQYTTNGGQIWKTIPTISTPQNISFSLGPVAFSSPKVGWFALNFSSSSLSTLYKWDGSSVLLNNTTITQTIDFSVYPNPSMGSISVAWRSFHTPPQYLRVLDVMGKVVYEKRQLSSDSSMQNLDLRSLSNGIYFVEIQTQNERGVKKIVIQQ